MNTRPTIQTKRKAPSKSGFRILRAATRRNSRRKQRAATTAAPEDLGEVPGVGVARALVVILLLHVAAIAGIYLHNKWNTSSDLKAASTLLDDKKRVKPIIVPGGETALVSQGDNYAKLAHEHGVSEDALRRANNNAEIESGWRINIPKRRIESNTPSEAIVGVIGDTSLPELESVPHDERPPIQPNNSQVIPNSVPGELVEVDPAGTSRTNEPLLISPRNHQSELATSNTSSLAAGGSYTVKSGDTLWGISQKNGVSVKDLLTINSMKENAVLKIGKVLKIPAH